MYIKHCTLNRSGQLELIEFFADTTGGVVADVLGTHLNSAILFFYKFREKIAQNIRR